jgi:hypothetical protein
MRNIFYGAATLALVCSNSVFASENNHQHHAAHIATPAGIMGEHILSPGQFMTSYSYEQMNMSGYLKGSDDMTAEQVIASGYSQAADDMSMQMHMFGLMGGVTENITAMIMIPYVQKTMTHIDSHNARMKMKSEGLGDIEISGITQIFSSDNLLSGHKINANLSLGLSLPTGAIDESFTHVHGDGDAESHHMDYAMQLGSGTFDPTFAASLADKFGRYSFGARAEYTPRFSENSENYRLGNEAKITTWTAAEVTDFMALSLRFDGKQIGNINGIDKKISRSSMPGGRAELQGGERIDGLVGVSIYKNVNSFGGHKLDLEYGIPLYQNLDGPQMKSENIMTLSYKLSF